MSYASVTESLLATQRHSLPTPKFSKNKSNQTYDTMPQTSTVDEKHTDTASIRSTSTMSSLKNLLSKKSTQSKPKKTKDQETRQKALRHEARAAYYTFKY